MFEIEIPAPKVAMKWFEENICSTCPKFTFSGGEICPHCDRTKEADEKYSAILGDLESERHE